MEKELVFKRKIYSKMVDWLNSPIHNSALLIEGARRVGKSTIVEAFAKDRFPGNYLIVDFRQELEEVKHLFDNIKDLNDFYRRVFLSQHRVLQKGGLIVFDEIQFCPKAREAIKDFVKDGRYYFIETGSLISIKENTKDIMIPSEERRIEMYPMDFEEYLWAEEGEGAFSLLQETIKKHETIPESVHREYLRKFRTYLLVGGMPKVLSIFLKTNSFKLANDEKLDILKLYRDDLRKHDNEHGTLCGAIFDSIPQQLAKENSRFVVRSVQNKKRYAQIRASLDDLCDFKIVNRVNHISSLESPISLQVEEEKFKLFFCDTGLLISKLIRMSDESMSQSYFDFINGKKVANLGSVCESVAVQQMVVGEKPVYYHKFDLLDKATKKVKTYELDLVTESDFKVQAIEIKSAKNYTTSSLDHIKQKYPQLKVDRFVFGIKNARYEGDKTTLPIYAIPQF